MIIKYSAEGAVEWARSVGGSDIEYINSVASTSDGGYIAGGVFESDEIQVGGYTLTNSSSDDGMIIKYNREGEVEWARSVGGNSADLITSVATTNDEGYIAGGCFRSSSIQVGDYTLTNSRSGRYDGMIIKYSSKGDVEWVRSVGENDDEYIRSVAGTSDGGIIAGGDFRSSSIQLEEYTLTNNGQNDAMIMKFEEKELVNVNVTKAEGIGGSNSDNIESVASTSDGGYIAGGYFQSRSIQVGDYTLTNNGENDGMIIKYDGEGEVEWAKSVGGNLDDRIESVTATSDGGYIAGGYFESSSIQVGEYILTNSGGINNGMIIKYSREGEVEWTRSVGRSSNQINSVTSTSDGGYIAGGYFQSSSIQVGDYTLTNNGLWDGMIIKYDGEGEVEWARSVGESSEDSIKSVAATSDGGAIAGGYFYSDEIQVE